MNAVLIPPCFYFLLSLPTHLCNLCVQERAPWLLFSPSGGASLSWAMNAVRLLAKYGIASMADARKFERMWHKSDDGQRLLANLRWDWRGSRAGEGLAISEVCGQVCRSLAQFLHCCLVGAQERQHGGMAAAWPVAR